MPSTICTACRENTIRKSSHSRRPFVHRGQLPVIVFILAAAGAALAFAADIVRSGGPYVPTPQDVVDKMLEVAEVSSNDFVMDLGSGDGRIVLTAASRHQARGRGIEIDSDLVDQSNREAHRRGLEPLVQFRSEDALKTRIDEASVLTLYLLPELMNLLRDRIYSELKPGARVVSHDFRFNDWIPDRSVTIEIDEKYGSAGAWQSTIYLWIVPAKIAGRWRATIDAEERQRYLFSFSQHFQRVAGEAYLGTTRVALRDVRLAGNRLAFTLAAADGSDLARRFSGTIDGNTIRGAIESPQGSVPWSAARVDSVKSARHLQ
ncbi:MAG: SAM-dependent methyltransferase [Betaproteobacteria bacterium]